MSRITVISAEEQRQMELADISVVGITLAFWVASHFSDPAHLLTSHEYFLFDFYQKYIFRSLDGGIMAHHEDCNKDQSVVLHLSRPKAQLPQNKFYIHPYMFPYVKAH